MDLTFSLTREQEAALEISKEGLVLLTGIAGSGKTTAAVHHIHNLIRSGVSSDQVLVLVPQRTLAEPYYNMVRSPAFPQGSLPTIVTIGGMARRMIALFWPLVCEVCNFARKECPPVFLTLETAQYYLAQIADQVIDSSSYFSSLRIRRNRIYSQVLDNLNKAALVGFRLDQMADRLAGAWNGESGHTAIYYQAQDIALKFRQYCYQNNLLDFSLQMEIFHTFLSRQAEVQKFLNDSYAHLIYDNIEEDAPASHDLVEGWLPQFQTGMFIMDENAGYRTFLGADPVSANRFTPYCRNKVQFEASLQSSAQVQQFSKALTDCIYHRTPEINEQVTEAFSMESFRLAPESTQTAAQEIARLVESDVQPQDIAVLTPILNDTTRFTLSAALDSLGIKSRSYRPSRPLNAEPAATCLLTFARLAHPDWELPVNTYELRSALMTAIEGMDMVRAGILSDTVLHKKQGVYELGSFDAIKDAFRLEQITYSLGERYEQLRKWLYACRQSEPDVLDVFLSRLFGEVLSQPGFGFHLNYGNAAICARLVESIQKFRRVVSVAGTFSGKDISREYVDMVYKGVLAAQYLDQDQDNDKNAVLIAPAYTFLMANQPVSFQFWLDTGSYAWSERLEQPLTHPYVLSRNWTAGEKWTHENELAVSQETLNRLVSGLAARCRQKIYLYSSGISEQGQEQTSFFLKALQRLNRSTYQYLEGNNV
jgi:energy-coupling factor transporter ATP-binding protein EcfA2